jgi:hypothetical protein
MSNLDPAELAAEYLRQTRAGSDVVERLARQLAGLSRGRLGEALGDDAARLAFWIDVYNATVLRQPMPELDGFAQRLRFFRRRLVTVAGTGLSLDDIEQGILRRSRWKLGLGYVSNPRPSAFEREFRVERVDPRIHFALNCGAASCPPFAAYEASRLDAQLDLATRSYLRATVDTREHALTLPAVMFWFIGDFGGPPGVRRFLREHRVEGWNRPLRMAAYDWTPTPARWLDEDSDGA